MSQSQRTEHSILLISEMSKEYRKHLGVGKTKETDALLNYLEGTGPC